MHNDEIANYCHECRHEWYGDDECPNCPKLADDTELKAFAVTMALSKSKLLGTVAGMLRGAEQAIESYMRAWNSYANDPELKDLLDILRKFSGLDMHYSDLLARSLGYQDSEDLDVKDEQRMRFEDAGLEVDEDSPTWDPDDLPWMDPIDMIRRKRGLTPYGTCEDESGCTNLAVLRDGSAKVCGLHTLSDTPLSVEDEVE